MSNIEKRPSDLIFDSLNRLNDAKLSGSLQKDELSKLLISVGDLAANKIKKGNMSNEDIDSLEVTFPKENCFSFEHEDISRAHKTALESIDMAKEYREQRNMSIPVDTKAKGLRRI